MTQEILNKKNIESLAISEKGMNARLQKAEEDIVFLKTLVTNMTLEIQSLKSKIQIQKVMGATSR